MKAILLFIALIPFGLRAQSLSPMVISSGGGSATTSAVSLDYNLGEVAVTTLSSSNNILTQGFEQPSSGTSSIVSTQTRETGINAWPNPASYILYVKADNISAGPAFVQLIDIQGRSLNEFSNVSLSGRPLAIPMQDLQPGMYMLRVINSQDGTIETLKIIKN